MRVLVFGASITQGFWDTEGGWVARLRRYYDSQSVADIKNEDNFPDVFNLGVSGDTTEDLLKRLGTEIQARYTGREDTALIFSIGTNNAYVENDVNKSSTEDYLKDLKKIIETSLDYTDKILFVGLPSCDEKRTTPVFWQDIYYTNQRLFEFETTMRKFCSENDLPHVPTFELIKEKQDAGQEMFVDGLHPNDDGHELIFQAVRPQLDKLLVGVGVK